MTKRGNGTKIIAIADSPGLPVTVHVESASPHKVKLVDTIDRGFTEIPRINEIRVSSEEKNLAS